MTTVFEQDIKYLLDARPPGSALVIDPFADHVLRDYAAGHPGCRVTRLDGADPLRALASLGRFDVGVVANTLERMDKREAGRLIARLRDLNTPRLYIVVPVGPRWQGLISAWEPADMIAYGMTLVRSREQDDKPVQLYQFDIADYKRNPDWLNADHWANPELWDKYRW